VLGVGLALASSLSWGTADFIGGVQSRRQPVLRVVLVSQAFGLLVIGVLLATRGVPAPSLGRLVSAGLAGLAGAAGLAAFYRGLATGSMSIVAPIAATGVGIPVIVGIVGGDRPAAIQLAGIGAAVVGVVLASREKGAHELESAGSSGTSIVLALASAAGFGTFFLGLHASARADPFWATFAARACSVVALSVVAAVWRRGLTGGADATSRDGVGRSVGVRGWVALAAVGTLDVGANALYALATRHGLLSVVSVLSSLYPLGTVGLARMLLGERVQRVQEIGVVAALTGVLLIAAG
jgi:drug/metabolite transporter (DMT)-like permease